MGFIALTLSGFLVSQCIWAVAAEGGFCYKRSDCGPRTWGGSCQSGSNQSPIDLPYNRQIYDGSKEVDLYQNGCYFQRQSFSLKNNGHSAQVELRSDQTSSCFMKGTLLNGKEYVFSNMHFHWGSNQNQGSEHTVNGRRFVMEGHLVHYQSRFKNISQALESKERDALTVIGIFFYLDPDNRDFAGLTPVVSGLRSVRSPKNAKIQGSDIRLSDFLYQSQNRDVGVIQYDGSLTTPGCSEVVLWNVLSPLCPISSRQLQEFRNLQDESDSQLADNYRPTQELNNRAIRYYRSSIR